MPWSAALHQILNAQGELPRWSVNENGTLDFRTDQAAELPDGVAALAAALVEAEDVVARLQIEADERDLARRQRKATHEAALETVKDTLPDWVDTIEWSDDGPGGGAREQWLLTVREDAQALRFGERTPNAFHDDRSHLMDLIRDHTRVDGCYMTGVSGKLGITPVVSTKDLLDILEHVDVEVRRVLEANQLHRAQKEATLAAAREAITAKLIELYQP